MNIRKRLVVGMLVIGLAACGGDGAGEVQDTATIDPTPGQQPPTATPGAAPGAAGAAASAVAVMRNAAGDEMGRATFTQEGEMVVITVDARNVQGGERAIHIHETGSCEAPGFQSAGGHFNPTNRSHGFNHPDGPHAGDFRNLVVDPDDNIAHGTYRTDLVTLRPGQPNSLLDGDGSALVIHAEADDYVSQPAGDAGDRILCGVITAA